MLQAGASFQAPQFNPAEMPSNQQFSTGLMGILQEIQRGKQQQEDGGSGWDILGPLGSAFGQTIDGKKGFDWGAVGNSAANNVKMAAKMAPMMM